MKIELPQFVLSAQTGAVQLLNISALISVYVIADMDISVYTVVTSSLALVAGMLISKFIFCENLTWKNYVSVFFAISSIIVGAL